LWYHEEMETNADLKKNDIIALLAVSVIFDLLQAGLDFIPGVGWALNVGVDVVAWIVFYFMLRRRGIRLNTMKLFLAFNSGLILDLVPFANMFAWTLDMLLVIGMMKAGKEDMNAVLDTVRRSR